MDFYDYNQESSDKDEPTNTLADVVNSINLETNVNNCIEEENKVLSNFTNEVYQEQNLLNLQNLQNFTTQLFTDTIDRRIGNYLLNELEKKQVYIEELEDAVKFQEKEITELKSKLEALNKLELLSKIKSNMETKLNQVETNLYQEQEQEQEQEMRTEIKPKVVQIKKISLQTQSKVIRDEEQYQKPNHDLVFRSDPGTKVKSIPKEEEEPRYNGVIMLDKPKNEPKTIIQLDYDNETSEKSNTMTDVLKQRRRARRL